MGVPATTGVRFALEPGAEAAAAPVRSAILGAADRGGGPRRHRHLRRQPRLPGLAPGPLRLELGLHARVEQRHPAAAGDDDARARPLRLAVVGDLHHLLADRRSGGAGHSRAPGCGGTAARALGSRARGRGPGRPRRGHPGAAARARRRHRRRDDRDNGARTSARGRYRCDARHRQHRRPAHRDGNGGGSRRKARARGRSQPVQRPPHGPERHPACDSVREPTELRRRGRSSR